MQNGLTLFIFIFLCLHARLMADITESPKIDCNCDKTGDYVKVKSGKDASIDLSSLNEAFSPNNIYRVEGGGFGNNLILNIYKISDGQKVLHGEFSGEMLVGFSPDDHRFVVWGLNSQSQQFVLLYDLQGSDPSDPVYTSIGNTGQGNEARVTFSANGKYLLYASIIGTNEAHIDIVDQKGNVKYNNTIKYSTAPGLENTTFGGAHWGFSPDKEDRTFVIGYLTSGNQWLKWQLVNLSAPSGDNIVNNPDPFPVVSSFWRFSPCGDVIARVTQSADNITSARMIKTLDGSESQLYQFGHSSVFFKSSGEQHLVRVGATVEFSSLNPEFPNTAGDDCDVADLPVWTSDKSLDASLLGSNEVVLEWSGAENAENYKIVQDGSDIDVVDKETNQYTISSLGFNTTYTFKVEAGDANDQFTTDGPEAVITTPNLDTIPPNWPENVRFTGHSHYANDLMLRWTSADDDVAVYKYNIYLADTLYNSFLADNLDDFHYYINGLSPGEQYTFKIEAEDLEENKSSGNPTLTLVYDPDSPPVWPTENTLIATEIDVTSMVLHWTPAVDNHFLYSYRIYQNGSYTSVYAADDFTEADTAYFMTRLEPNTEYTFQIKALDEDYLESADGPQLTVSTPRDTIPPDWSFGSFLWNCKTGTDFVDLLWVKAVDNVAVKAYRIFKDEILIDSIDAHGSYETYRVTGLQPGTEYTFRIEAGDAAGNWGGTNQAITLTTLETLPENPFIKGTQYELTPVGNEDINAWDMNDLGQVVGIDRSETGNPRAFLWEPDTMLYIENALEARAINNKGHVAGYFREPLYGEQRVFFWKKGNSILDIGTLGGDVVYFSDMNENGQIVGSARYAPLNSAGFEKAYLWDPADSTIIDLGTLGGEVNMYWWERVTSSSLALNNESQVVGYSPAAVEDRAERHGFLWENGDMIDLDPSAYLYPADIDDAGRIATQKISNSPSRGLLWQYGITLDIGTLGGPNTRPIGITQQGMIYGESDIFFRTCKLKHARHAILWNGERLIDLGTLGGDNSQASDMNEHQQVVGWGELFDGIRHAFLWEDGVKFDIHPEGFSTSRAMKINENGQILIMAEKIEETSDEETGGTFQTHIQYAFVANPVAIPEITITGIEDFLFCYGASFDVHYSISGQVNPDNQFIVQLSSYDGTFYNPVNLKTEKVNDGTLQATLPFSFPTVPSGYTGQYRIRIIATDPAIISDDNGEDFTFEDCAPALFTEKLESNEICAGDSVSVSYIAPAVDLDADNQFMAELSDAEGDFSNPHIIGTISSTASGSINALIPLDIPPGTGYRIRVNSTYAGSLTLIDNREDITIKAKPVATLILEGETLIASEGDTYEWYFNMDTLEVMEKTFTPVEEGNYAVKITVNGCYDISDIINYQITGLDWPEGHPVIVFPNPTSGNLNISNVGFGNIKHIKIVNINGNTVFDTEVNTFSRSENNSIGIHLFLKTGIYLLKFIDESQTIIGTRKLIVH